MMIQNANGADSLVARPVAVWNARRHLVAFTALWLLSCVPLLAVQTVPLVDVPNHLARVHILRRLAADQTLQQYFVAAWDVSPNLGFDIFAIWLMPFASPALALKFFLALSSALMVVGTILISYGLHRRFEPVALLAMFALFPRPLAWGFLNFYVAVSLALFTLGAWLCIPERRRLHRAATLAVGATLTYFSHLFPFVLLLITVGAIDLQKALTARPLAAGALFRRAAWLIGPFLPGIILFVGLSPTSQQRTPVVYGNLIDRLSAPFSWIRSYSPVLDGLFMVCLALLIGLAFANRALRVNRSAWLAIGLLVLILLATPRAMFSAQGVHQRTAVYLAPLLFSALSVRPIARRRQLLRAAGVAIVVLFAARTASIGLHWRQYERQMSQAYRPLFTLLEPGARVAWTYLGPSGFSEPPHRHWIQLAVLQKPLLINGLFAMLGQQPLRYAPACREAAAMIGMDGNGLNWYFEGSRAESQHPSVDGSLAPFDYLVVGNPAYARHAVPDDFQVVYATDIVVAYKRIRPPSEQTAAQPWSVSCRGVEGEPDPGS